MLTPRFSLGQDDQFLHVTIYAPFTHIDKTEVFMDEDEFRFYSKPYYLRLHLPGEVIENEDASASWEAESNSFVVKCPKKKEGEHFSGLDMLTDLLTPKGEKEIKNKIEIIGGENDEVIREIEDEVEEIDFYFEQKLPEDIENHQSIGQSDGYGFAFQQYGVYKTLLAEYGEILDIQDPDHMTQIERNSLRDDKEMNDFNSDHYLSDLFDSIEEIDSCLEAVAPFSSCIKGPLNFESSIEINDHSEELAFSQTEQELMLALPRKKLIVQPQSLASVHYGLADILFGYCYSLRVLGSDCVELGWCSAKLSSSLSCLARFSSAKSLLVTSIRRSLCYPLYRHYDLGVKVWKDVITILQVGTAAVLKCLLALIPKFNNSPGEI